MIRSKITLLDITIIIISTILIIFYGIININKKGKTVKITNHKGEIFLYPLNENRIIEIQGKIGITKIEIKNGKVRFIDSPCRDKLCVNIGFVNSPLIPIVCLPNGVSCIVIDKNQTIFDGATY